MVMLKCFLWSVVRALWSVININYLEVVALII